jgi:hypothetical protein
MTPRSGTKTTAKIQYLRWRALNGCAFMLVNVHSTTASQIAIMHTKTWPFNFTAWRLNRENSSLIEEIASFWIGGPPTDFPGGLA